MYTNFSIKNFRCFDSLELTDLKRVNLIAGKNNVGKTALLEALFVYSGGYNPELPLRLNVFRGISKIRVELSQWSVAPWDPLFSEFDTTKEVIFEGIDIQRGTHSLHLTVVNDIEELKKVRASIQQSTNGSGNPSSASELPIRVLRLNYQDGEQNKISHVIMSHEGLSSEIVPASPFQSIFLTSRSRPPLEEEADRFTDLIVEGKKTLLLEILKIIESRLNNLELLKYGGDTMIHADIGMGRPIPLMFLGDGMSRLSSIVGAMNNAKNGVVIIDEIENGIHYSVLKDVWKAIGQAAREFNVQIFATTHSWECIVAAHQAFAESDEYDFKYHRLERNKTGEISPVSYDQETLEATIDMNLEAR